VLGCLEVAGRLEARVSDGLHQDAVVVEDADDFDEAVVVGLVDPEAATQPGVGGRSVGCMSLSGRAARGGGPPPRRLCLRGRLDGLGLLVFAGLAVEELDAVGDDFELLAA
jgi:hypothetical protein